MIKGRYGYFVRRTIIPDDKLEEKFISDQNNKVQNIFLDTHNFYFIYFLLSYTKFIYVMQ
jgi:hypothetical protein